MSTTSSNELITTSGSQRLARIDSVCRWRAASRRSRISNAARACSISPICSERTANDSANRLAKPCQGFDRGKFRPPTAAPPSDPCTSRRLRSSKYRIAWRWACVRRWPQTQVETPAITSIGPSAHALNVDSQLCGRIASESQSAKHAAANPTASDARSLPPAAGRGRTGGSGEFESVIGARSARVNQVASANRVITCASRENNHSRQGCATPRSTSIDRRPSAAQLLR